jgi:hypothetical protein
VVLELVFVLLLVKEIKTSTKSKNCIKTIDLLDQVLEIIHLKSFKKVEVAKEHKKVKQIS